MIPNELRMLPTCQATFPEERRGLAQSPGQGLPGRRGRTGVIAHRPRRGPARPPSRASGAGHLQGCGAPPRTHGPVDPRPNTPRATAHSPSGTSPGRLPERGRPPRGPAGLQEARARGERPMVARHTATSGLSLPPASGQDEGRHRAPARIGAASSSGTGSEPPQPRGTPRPRDTGGPGTTWSPRLRWRQPPGRPRDPKAQKAPTTGRQWTRWHAHHEIRAPRRTGVLPRRPGRCCKNRRRPLNQKGPRAPSNSDHSIRKTVLQKRPFAAPS